MGNITGAMVFQSTIPTVVALVFASSTWVVTEDTWVAFASAGIAFLSSAVIFIPMARSGVLTQEPARRRRLLPGLPGARRRDQVRTGRNPLIYSPDRSAGAREC
jgi:hypothetical protein